MKAMSMGGAGSSALPMTYPTSPKASITQQSKVENCTP